MADSVLPGDATLRATAEKLDAADALAHYRDQFYIDDEDNESPLPEVDGLAVVHITSTGSDLYEVADPASAWTAFKHVAWLASQMDAIKAQITEPTA